MSNHSHSYNAGNSGIGNIVDAFSDPEAVARYTENPLRLVPGYESMQRMATILLAERVPENARVLVVGAGGGLELKVFAQTHPGWVFDGVDPSAEMLRLAERILGPHASRATLHHGYVEGAPTGPFDAATCLLTLHFLPVEERRRTLAAIHLRLKPGAPLVVAHHSIPSDEKERAVWLDRYAAFAIASGIEPDKAMNAREGIGKHLPILSPEQDEAMLREAGFSQVSLFYVGFTFRGWVALA